ncbi:MAG: tetratricopeptide repeat protein [Planctomycetes bacterium]|nr:tetratricopeptide repeat protein [Planctomycetota bacterium]
MFESGETVYLFRHAMLREGAYGLHLPSVRSALHASVVDILESILSPGELEGIAGELADHCRAGASANPDCHARELHWLGVHGDRARRAGRPEEALQAFSRIARHEHAEGGTRLKAKFDLAEVLAHIGRETQAMEDFGEIVPEAARNGDERLHAEALTHWAPLALARGQVDESRDALEQALQLNRRLQRREAEADVLSRLSMLARHVGDPALAEKLITQAIEVQRESNDSAARAQTLITLADVLLPQQRYAEVEGALEEAEAIAEQTGKRYLMMHIHTTHAAMAGGRGDWAGSEQSIRKAIEISRETGARSDTAGLLDQLGGSLRMQGNFAEAEPYHRQAMELLEEIGDEMRLGVVAMNYAGLCKRMGRMEEAGELYERALRHVDRSRDVRLRGHGRGNYAEYLHKQGRLEESREMFSQSLELLAQSGDVVVRAIQQGRFAALLMRMGRRDEAASAFTESLSVLQGAGNDFGIGVTRQAMGEVCEELGLETPPEPA